ncbi:hypothetical protein, partial [Zhongshania antarctica]
MVTFLQRTFTSLVHAHAGRTQIKVGDTLDSSPQLAVLGIRMTKYRPYQEITAQSINVATLMGLFNDLEKRSDNAAALTPVVVFLAFSMESYINSLGAQHLDIWDELERLPWKKKITILHKTVSKSPDWGSPPLQFASQIFKLRDRLAHGKPEIVYGPVLNSEEEAVEVLRNPTIFQPDWYSTINKVWLLESKNKFRTLMVYLGELFDRHESDHLAIAYTGIEELPDKNF